MDSTPETIGKYKILRIVGRGGMGTVYEALDPLINRKLAIKMMTPGLADSDELRARFLREAQAAGGLRHRNIVTVYDLGEDRGQPYIAMEFIEGSDLEKLMQPPGLGLERKLAIVRQVCEGLGYAHKHGIVHRDVKPANIRVTPEGDVKIMDFGIAHLQSSTMTKSGLVLGTVHYMAPEQLAGEKVDHRADIFSVGVIAYELLAGRKPFDGESLTSVMFKIIHENADAQALPRTPLSPRLDRVVMRALARKVDERYGSLDELRAELEALGQSEPPVVHPAELERGRLREDLARARAEGHLQKALALAQRLVELDPRDAQSAREAAELESAIRDREIEQLCGVALAYAAEGESDLAAKIAARIEKLDAKSPRYRKLRRYLDEEAARRVADALTATAQEHLALGNLVEARAAAEEALRALPSHGLAREIRDRATAVLAVQERRRPVTEPPAPAATLLLAPEPIRDRDHDADEATLALPRPVPPPEPPPGRTAAPPPPAPPRLREETQPMKVVSLRPPAVEEPPAGIPAAPAARRDDETTPLKAPAPAPKIEPVRVLKVEPATASRPAEPAGQGGDETVRLPPAKPSPATDRKASPAPADAARRAEVESLTSSALEHFVGNRHAKARQAIEKALALDPANKKAKDLLKILGPLG